MTAASMPSLPNAACRNTAPTKALCATCWDRPECLAWALEHEAIGLWAGYKPFQLAALREQFGIQLKEIIGFNDFAKAGA